MVVECYGRSAHDEPDDAVRAYWVPLTATKYLTYVCIRERDGATSPCHAIVRSNETLQSRSLSRLSRSNDDPVEGITHKPSVRYYLKQVLQWGLLRFWKQLLLFFTPMPCAHSLKYLTLQSGIVGSYSPVIWQDRTISHVPVR